MNVLSTPDRVSHDATQRKRQVETTRSLNSQSFLRINIRLFNFHDTNGGIGHICICKITSDRWNSTTYMGRRRHCIQITLKSTPRLMNFRPNVVDWRTYSECMNILWLEREKVMCRDHTSTLRTVRLLYINQGCLSSCGAYVRT